MNFNLRQMLELIRIFELSIFDLSVKLKNEQGTLSPEDIENTNFVIGMARTNSVCLQKTLALGAAYYKANEANAEKVDRLISEATALAESLKAEGFGTSKFSMGQIVSTTGALAVLAENYTLPEDLLNRHAIGDWGDLDAEDKERNTRAIQDGARIFSAYILAEDVKVWVITEAQDDDGVRASTTILLPEEY